MTRLTLRAAVVCLLAGATPATTFLRTSTKDLVDMAERVCCARCESIEQRVDARSGLVFTYVRLRLMEDMKGRRGGNVIELRLVGGRAGGAVTEVVGMPRFVRGGECVLMLGKENRQGYPVVVQAARGALHLRKDKQGRRRLARAVTGLPGLPSDRRVSLDAFRDAVKRTVREQQRARRR